MAWCRISPPLTAVLELSELLELLELLALVLITHIPGHLQGSTPVALIHPKTMIVALMVWLAELGENL